MTRELNGDILVYYPVLDIALELSSMGIRVDEESLTAQLTEAGCDDRRELDFQKAVLNAELPYTIGGGIGQSRICMFFLLKSTHRRSTRFSLAGRNAERLQRRMGFCCCK